MMTYVFLHVVCFRTHTRRTPVSLSSTSVRGDPNQVPPGDPTVRRATCRFADLTKVRDRRDPNG